MPATFPRIPETSINIHLQMGNVATPEFPFLRIVNMHDGDLPVCLCARQAWDTFGERTCLHPPVMESQPLIYKGAVEFLVAEFDADKYCAVCSRAPRH